MDDLEWPLFTLEPSWKENKILTSCIPAMVYILEPFNSPKHGGCFIIKDVPKRTVVEVHIGNLIKDTLGCVIIGQNSVVIKGELGVAESRKALQELLQIIKEPRELYISNEW